jgi:type IV pilus assembly protein PilX
MTHPIVLRRPSRGGTQRGVVLVFALITLVILLIGAVAVSRSINASQFMSGNLGFKRDLSNQGERALQAVMNAVRTGPLADVTARNDDLKSANYKATLLPTNAQGIPTALLSDGEFEKVGSADRDIQIDDMSVKVRYVIDRLASTTGNCGPSQCALANQTTFGGGSSEWINSQGNSGVSKDPNPGAAPQQPVYRISVRVRGARGTLSFFQSTFTTN